MTEARIMALQRAITAAERFVCCAQREIIAMRGGGLVEAAYDAAERRRAISDLTALLLSVRDVDFNLQEMERGRND